ncbi:Cupin domain-containing protein [Luteibacter sp. UNCMF331Sha3.1]|uniref:cupin domain-containing protein n=1 Tax=Luteibacter sp. UNCMF331Sha3.1 TaxID=1502760 RepID=UPI0008C3C2AF|nr:cupin domain-containing protein [Luteibacter sp. UNCMF331Sha3.1]SEM90577.1 Cupin domain-containing protein [Luteibacter sp. UNCMF331Sha3.1]
MVPKFMGIALALASMAGIAHAEKTASAKADVLVRTDASWNGVAYTAYTTGRPELTVLKMTIPAHTALPWHTHPIPNAAYVLSGSITVEDKASGRKQAFHAGEALAEEVGQVHRGVTGDEPAVLVVTYAGTPGTPTFVPEQGQKPEY